MEMLTQKARLVPCLGLCGHSPREIIEETVAVRIALRFSFATIRKEGFKFKIFEKIHEVDSVNESHMEVKQP
jgi:hypothetical protein